jgi:hypothetical protein
MSGRSKSSASRPEPWWAKFVLALLKLLLAFALAVLTLILSSARRQGGSAPNQPATHPGHGARGSCEIAVDRAEV